MTESRGPEFPDGPDFPEFTEAELTSVFDDAFVAAATVHEPPADERLAGGRGVGAGPAAAGSGPGDGPGDVPGGGLGDHAGHDPGDGLWSPPGRAAAWRRGVAWVLAVVMGVGVVAMTAAALHRAGSGPSRQQPRPAVGSEPPVPGQPESFGPAAGAG